MLYGKEQANKQGRLVKASSMESGYFCDSRQLKTVKQAVKVGHMGEKWISDTVFVCKGEQIIIIMNKYEQHKIATLKSDSGCCQAPKKIAGGKLHV